MINRRIRIVGAAMLVCFVLLFLQLNNIQVREASSLSKKFDVVNPPTSKWKRPRGAIFSADGKILAESIPSHDQYRWQRVYPAATAQAFANIIGYVAASPDIATQFGLEAYYNSYLEEHTGGGTLTQHQETDDLILTINTKLQLLAQRTLQQANEPGSAVVAIDPRNGDILAMAGYPTYDPNLFASHNLKTALAAFKKYVTSTPYYENPVFNIPTFVTRAPGSTFKTITTSAIFDHAPRIANQVFPSVPTYTFPNSGHPPVVIQNYAKEICGGTLPQALAKSCDTSFSEIGVELGAQTLGEEARSFGFDHRIPIDLPSQQVSVANFPPTNQITATPFEGYSAIGQYNDAASPLQMALVVAGLANNGKIMTPHIVQRIIDGDGQVAVDYHPHVWRVATSASTAQKVRTLMLGVTENPAGTAYGLFHNPLPNGTPAYYSQGFPQVAAKTGTAEPQKNVCGTYNWLVAMAPAGPGQTPTVAIAAMVPIPSNSLSCATSPTGASVAGPVLLPVLEGALKMNLP
jgi:peptidoglycan glycosyltransferase